MKRLWLIIIFVSLLCNVYSQKLSSPFGGWCHYRDTTYSTTNRLTINDGDTTTFPNKGALTIITDYMPLGDSTFWDTTNNKIIPPTVGESYHLRIDLKAEPQANDMSMTIALDIGGSQGHIVEQVFDFPKGNGVEHSVSLGFPFYTLNTFVSNGGTIEIMPSGGNLEIWNTGIYIAREHKL